jgi:hypothetical protein
LKRKRQKVYSALKHNEKDEGTKDHQNQSKSGKIMALSVN